GRGDVLFVPFHRTGEHPHPRDRAGAIAGQRDGRFHFHDPPFRRLVVPKDCRPPFGRDQFATGGADSPLRAGDWRRVVVGVGVENKVPGRRTSIVEGRSPGAGHRAPTLRGADVGLLTAALICSSIAASVGRELYE